MCVAVLISECNSAYLCSRLDWRRWPLNIPGSSTWLRECCCKNWSKPSASPSTRTFSLTRCINTRRIAFTYYLWTPDVVQSLPHNSFALAQGTRAHRRAGFSPAGSEKTSLFQLSLCQGDHKIKSKIPPLHTCVNWSLSPCFPFCRFQIILMSATINCRQFAEYFCTTIRGKMNPAYVFEVEGVPHAIEEFYLDDLQPYRARRQQDSAHATGSVFVFLFFLSQSSMWLLYVQQVKLPHVDCPGISVEMYNLAISLIQSFDEMEGKESRWGLSIRAQSTSLQQTL